MYPKEMVCAVLFELKFDQIYDKLLTICVIFFQDMVRTSLSCVKTIELIELKLKSPPIS